jgi:hypothetical protein
MPPGPPRADCALGAETETPPVMPAGFFLPFALPISRARRKAPWVGFFLYLQPPG